ncbi:MAG: stage II sporulation protein M [Methanomicrobiales archaeon]
MQNPEVGMSLMKLFEKTVAAQILENYPVDICLKLFLNNIEACTLLFLGSSSICILTIFVISLNGMVIGSMMEIIHTDHSWAFIIAALHPHGIFEIPAFIILGALGILLARSLISGWYGRADTAVEAQKLARVFLLYVLPPCGDSSLCRGFYYAGNHTLSIVKDQHHGRRPRHPAAKRGFFCMV